MGQLVNEERFDSLNIVGGWQRCNQNAHPSNEKKRRFPLWGCAALWVASVCGLPLQIEQHTATDTKKGEIFDLVEHDSKLSLHEGPEAPIKSKLNATNTG